MGAGNYLPKQEIREGWYEMVYVNMPDVEDEIEQELFESNLRIDISDCLPPSFQRVENNWAWENRVLHVELVSYYAYYALVVAPIGRFDDPRTNYGAHHLERVAKRLFRGLKDIGYELSVRTGPLTSGVYEYEHA